MTRNRRVRSFVKQHKRLGRWRYAVTVLTAVIVFCTVYALILPAITMERATVCGHVEHAHTKECFTADGELICTITEHTHTDACCPSDKEADQTAATPDEASPAAELPTVQAEKAAPLRVVRAHRDLAKTGTGTIASSKQIEHFGGDDSYDYRLHLTVDGSSLEGTETELIPDDSKKKRAAIIIDVTETMTSTSLSGSGASNKFEAVRQILLEQGGFLEQFLNGTNEVTIIAVDGTAGRVSYTTIYRLISPAHTTELNEVQGAWNSQHGSHTLSYITGLMAVDDYYGTEEDVNIIFIAGNAPKTYVKYAPGERGHGEVEMGTTNPQSYDKNLQDYYAWMNDHPNATFYGVGINSQSGTLEGGSETLQTMGEYSGGYYSTDNASELIDHFQDIIEKIIPGDKTKNLIVTDVLSGNVEFADSRNLTATLYTGYNSSTNMWSSTATYTESDDELSVSGNTVTFSRPDEIDGSFKLEISFDIKTADEVYKDTTTYPSTGYPNTGDADTDWGSNNTSSGKAGYYSNADSGVSYTLNGTDASAAFAMPVVQAPSVTKDINVTKHWSGNLVPQEVTLTLYTESGGTYTVLDTISLSAVQDAEGSYTYTFPSGETEKTIYLVEGSAVDTLPMYSGTTAKINLGSGEVDAAVITLTSDGSDVSVTVTNWPTTQMPATGGTGTTPFIMIGSALILVAGSVLIFRRKRGAA